MDELTKRYAYDVAPGLGYSSAHSQEWNRLNNGTPMSNYAEEFFNRAKRLKNADVAAFRNYVLKNGPFVDESVAPDLPKSNRKAFTVRQDGNRLYRTKDFEAALEKYNESICWAEGDSEDLGIGYANRSAIYYDMEEYDLSLHNIALAKKHGYPRRLMPKLFARELKCKDQIVHEPHMCDEWRLQLPINVETHPRVPLMAAGIKKEELPCYGRSMVADRDFKAGDVILQEQALLTAISPELKYKNCNHCSIDNFHSLIPCPICVSVMYCSEDCLYRGQKIHRFECGITEKLHHVSHGSSRIFLGSKAFFYGLNRFKDLKTMMDYSTANDRTRFDPFTLDSEDLETPVFFEAIHKATLHIKKFECEDLFRFYAAVYYSIYMKHPLVNSIFHTKAEKTFMLRSILDYMRIIGFLVIGPRQSFTTQLYLYASVCNHSCDPNTVAVTYFGQLKFIVIRPILADDQILISYGPLAREHPEKVRRQFTELFHFDCICDTCNEFRRCQKLAEANTQPPIPPKVVATMHKLIDDPESDEIAKLNMLQHFAQRYVSAFPREDYVVWLDIYRKLLVEAFTKEVRFHQRNNACRLAFLAMNFKFCCFLAQKLPDSFAINSNCMGCGQFLGV